MWNTGCNVIYNRTAKRLLYVVDGEDSSHTLLVPPDGESSFTGTIFPWADGDNEVISKAFRVQYYTASTFRGWFYLYQDYRTDTLCWADWTSTTPYQDGKANAASFKASYVDVQIGAAEDEEGNLTVPAVEFVKVS
ncbi:MAG TPA: hypothetical protein VHZ03_14985 [Trebonia sp.]|jgi:hypothetical protein|nr:hypothetical protein [Trebonia sp.]